MNWSQVFRRLVIDGNRAIAQREAKKLNFTRQRLLHLFVLACAFLRLLDLRSHAVIVLAK